MVLTSDTQRLVGWGTAIDALRGQPAVRWVLGWGPETYRAVYRLYRTQRATDFVGADRVADHVHNLPLEAVLTLGVVGTAALAYLLWCLWRDTDDYGRAAMLGLGVVSMVEPVFFPPAGLLFLILGARQYAYTFTGYRPAGRVVAAGTVFLAALATWAGLPRLDRLVLHPHESEANQVAIIGALSTGRLEEAVIYAQRAAAADPKHRDLQKQTASLEAAVRARTAR